MDKKEGLLNPVLILSIKELYEYYYYFSKIGIFLEKS